IAEDIVGWTRTPAVYRGSSSRYDLVRKRSIVSTVRGLSRLTLCTLLVMYCKNCFSQALRIRARRTIHPHPTICGQSVDE
ncbi:hypothetical protein J6590_087988, partial [Homalodisca vitripennis]